MNETGSKLLCLITELMVKMAEDIEVMRQCLLDCNIRLQKLEQS